MVYQPLLARELPDIGELVAIAEKLGSFWPDDVQYGHPGWLGIFKDISENSERKILLNKAHELSDEVIRSTIFRLADLYKLGNEFEESLPSIIVYDKTRYEGIRLVWSMDEKMHRLPRTFYAPEGIKYLKHPEGPVISIDLRDMSHVALIEESVHFLHNFYEKVQGKLDELLIFTEDRFARSIFHEAIAYYTLCLFGIEPEFEDEYDKNIASYEYLSKVLQEKGVKSFFFQLRDEFEVDCLEELGTMERVPGVCNAFPDYMLHYFGNDLGRTLAGKTRRSRDIKRVSEIAFKPVDDYYARFEEFLKYSKRKN